MQQCKEMCLLTMYHLGFVGDVQTRIVLFCVFPSLMEQDRFHLAFDAKECVEPSFAVGSCIVFPWQRYNQLQDVCNFVHVRFVSFIIFPLF